MASIIRFDKSSIADASLIVREGGLIVFPTDTVYGLGCEPENGTAVERLFEAKKREGKPIPVLCNSLDSALELVEMNENALSLATRHWPGPLTIVAPLKKALPFLMHQGTGTLGVRVPNSELCIELIRACGGHLTGTSANVSGSPASRTAEEAERQLGGSVDLILDGGTLTGLESTVVRVFGDRIEAIRWGSIGVTDETE